MDQIAKVFKNQFDADGHLQQRCMYFYVQTDQMRIVKQYLVTHEDLEMFLDYFKTNFDVLEIDDISNAPIVKAKYPFMLKELQIERQSKL